MQEYTLPTKALSGDDKQLIRGELRGKYAKKARYDGKRGCWVFSDYATYAWAARQAGVDPDAGQAPKTATGLPPAMPPEQLKMDTRPAAPRFPTSTSLPKAVPPGSALPSATQKPKSPIAIAADNVVGPDAVSTSILAGIAQETVKAAAVQAFAEEREEDFTRLEKQKEAAARSGFALKETVVPFGDRVNGTGVSNATLFKAEYDNLPKVPEGFERLRGIVKAEDRQDLKFKFGDMSMDGTTGNLVVAGAPLVFTDIGFSQLFTMMVKSPRYAGACLSDIDVDQRADVVNRLLRSGDNRDKEIVLRTRRPDAGRRDRAIYAVVSTIYEDFGPLKLMDAIEHALRSEPDRDNYRCEIEYRGSSTKIQLVSHSTVAPERYCAGEVFHAAAAFMISDDKTGGIESWAEVIRNLCRNLICLDYARTAAIKFRHVGTNGKLAEALQQGMKQAFDAIHPFVEMWSEKRGVTVDDVFAEIRCLCAAEEDMKKAEARIAVPGIKPENMLAWMLEAYNKEPEPTLTGIANAVARVPQVGSFSDPLEAQAILASQSYDILRNGL